MNKNIKNILISSKEIIITYILQISIIITSYIIYNKITSNNINKFINYYGIIIIIIYSIIVSIYLYNKNRTKKNQLIKRNIYYYINLGLTISTLFNMIIFKLYPPVNIQQKNIILIFISTSIAGPIYEEILFRYILLNKLKQNYSNKTSILISTLIFSILHINPIKIIYSFILGLILNITYNKTNNILSTIIIHITANSVSLLLTEYNKNILILSVINALLLFVILKEKNKNSIA